MNRRFTQIHADLCREKQMELNRITERITGWLWYSICVNLRLSSERSERAVTREGTADEPQIALQGKEPQMNADERRFTQRETNYSALSAVSAVTNLELQTWN